MTDELREIEESIALALADVYAGEPFRDSTFEQGTAAVMAIVGPIVAARDEAMRQRQEASDRFIDHYNGTAGHLDRIGQLESALRERTGERDEAKGHVEMHMGHRLQIEAMLDEIIGTEPIEDVDGFVANVAYALRRLQDERDERFTSVVHQCCEDLQALRASAVVLPEDWRGQIKALEQSAYDATRAAGYNVTEEQRTAFEAGVDQAAELIDSWRAATTESAPRPEHKDAIDADHVIEFRDNGWAIKHPLSCRPSLFDCPVSRAAEAQLDEPPEVLGRFVVSLTNDGLLRVGDPV